MTKTDIKIEMIKRNITLKDIADSLGVSISAICKVKNRASVSKRIQKTIADAINRPVEEVFPPKEAE